MCHDLLHMAYHIVCVIIIGQKPKTVKLIKNSAKTTNNAVLVYTIKHN